MSDNMEDSAECKSHMADRLAKALMYTLEYGKFDSASDNPLHAGCLDTAKKVLTEYKEMK